MPKGKPLKPQIIVLEFLGMGSFHIWKDKGKNFHKKEGNIVITIGDEATVTRLRKEGKPIASRVKEEKIINAGANEKFEIDLEEFRKVRQWKPATIEEKIRLEPKSKK